MSEEAVLKSAVMDMGWVEYSVICTMLLLSLLIGIYYGWFKKQDTVAEYMLGGKKMGVFPVVISLISSHISGITLLGAPSEIYTYGTQYCSEFVSIVATFLITRYIFLPVFYPLQLISIYEYLELRFSQGTRTLGSLIFAISLIVYIPVVIYVPSLAFNQVTGISVNVVALTISLICIFYTSFGGLRAVVWADTLQGLFTLGSTIFVVFLGFWDFGSISEVLRINNEGGRLELFNMDPSPFVRMSFWTYCIGTTSLWISLIPCSPVAMQRFISVSTLSKANTAALGMFIGMFVIIFSVVLVGLLEYATYHDCDPVATKRVQKVGQILLLYVFGLAENYPGVTGLFISGVLSAALSNMSADLNTVAGTFYEDFVMYVRKGKKLPEGQQMFITKVIVLVVGLICAALVTVIQKLGAIYQVCIALRGVTNGALTGIFTLGVFFPRANAKGAIAGLLVSLVTMSTVVIGSQYYTLQGKLKYPGKVTRVDGCPANYTDSLSFNVSASLDTYTGVGSQVIADESVSLIFQLSFLYYNVAGALILIIVALVVSYLTEPVDPKCLDPQLFASFVRGLLPKKVQLTSRPPTDVDEYKLVSTNPSQEIMGVVMPS